MFADMRRAGFGIGVSKSKLVQAMLEVLPHLPSGTHPRKGTVVSQLGLFGQMSPTRNIDAAWNEVKRKAAREYPDRFILDDRDVLHRNDGSIKPLDKKISPANMRKLNELAGAENCTVNQIVSKLMRHYQRGKARQPAAPTRRGVGSLARPITRLEPIPLRSSEGAMFTCPERDGSAAAPLG